MEIASHAAKPLFHFFRGVEEDFGALETEGIDAVHPQRWLLVWLYHIMRPNRHELVIDLISEIKTIYLQIQNHDLYLSNAGTPSRRERIGSVARGAADSGSEASEPSRVWFGDANRSLRHAKHAFRFRRFWPSSTHETQSLQRRRRARWRREGRLILASDAQRRVSKDGPENNVAVVRGPLRGALRREVTQEDGRRPKKVAQKRS